MPALAKEDLDKQKNKLFLQTVIKGKDWLEPNQSDYAARMI